MINTAVEREISVFVLLAALLKKIWLILGLGLLVFLLCAAVLYSTPQSYETDATILISKTRSNEESFGEDKTLVDTDSYASALLSGEVLQKVMVDFKLDQPPFEYDLNEMDSVISVWPIRNQNSVQIRVRLKNLVANTPELVAEIANHLATEGDRIAQQLLKEDIKRSLSIYDAEYQESKNHLEEIRAKHRAAILNAPLEEKRKLIDSLGEAQKLMLSSLSTAQSDYVSKSAQMREIDKTLIETPPTLEFTRALEEEPSVLGMVADLTGKATAELFSVTSTRQEVNPVYVTLKNLRDQTSSEAEAALSAISKLPEYVEQFSRQIQKAESILNASQEEVKYLEMLVETAQLGFREVYKRREMAVMAISSDRQDLISWIKAIPPIKPTGLPRLLIAVITAGAAVILLTVLLLMLEIIKKSSANAGR